jgi:hypothetical protein
MINELPTKAQEHPSPQAAIEALLARYTDPVALQMACKQHLVVLDKACDGRGTAFFKRAAAIAELPPSQVRLRARELCLASLQEHDERLLDEMEEDHYFLATGQGTRSVYRNPNPGDLQRYSYVVRPYSSMEIACERKILEQRRETASWSLYEQATAFYQEINESAEPDAKDALRAALSSLKRSEMERDLFRHLCAPIFADASWLLDGEASPAMAPSAAPAKKSPGPRPKLPSPDNGKVPVPRGPKPALRIAWSGSEASLRILFRCLEEGRLLRGGVTADFEALALPHFLVSGVTSDKGKVEAPKLPWLGTLRELDALWLHLLKAGYITEDDYRIRFTHSSRHFLKNDRAFSANNHSRSVGRKAPTAEHDAMARISRIVEAITTASS